MKMYIIVNIYETIIYYCFIYIIVNENLYYC